MAKNKTVFVMTFTFKMDLVDPTPVKVDIYMDFP